MQCKSEPSPLARGTLNEQNKSGELNPVHPRLRGELDSIDPYSIDECGSSPLARGTLLGGPSSGRSLRFIPACAGNSLRQFDYWERQSVHPRLRGELSFRLMNSIRPAGSSPLARGTRIHKGPGAIPGRFIPACAGNSLKWLQYYTNRLTAKLLKNISKQE